MKDELKYLDEILNVLISRKTIYTSLTDLCFLVDEVEITGDIEKYRVPAKFMSEKDKGFTDLFEDLIRISILKMDDALIFLEQEKMITTTNYGYRVTYKGLIQTAKSYHSEYSSDLKEKKLKRVSDIINIIVIVLSFLLGTFLKEAINFVLSSF